MIYNHKKERKYEMKANKEVMGNISTKNQNQKDMRVLGTVPTAARIRGLIESYAKELEVERIKNQMFMRARDGYVIGRVHYGYKISADKRFEVDYEVAGVVKLIFDKYVDGYGSTAIARLLKDLGIQTPREYYENIENPTNNWNRATILRILKNKTYAGCYRFYRYRTDSGIDDEVLEIKNNHEPIISEEVFIEVQRILDMRKRELGGRVRKSTKHLGICVDCRRPFHD